jgi:hypothetical protein
MPKIQVQIPKQRFPSNLKQLLDLDHNLGFSSKETKPPNDSIGENNINIFSYFGEQFGLNPKP